MQDNRRPLTINVDPAVIEKLEAAAGLVHLTLEEYARLMLGVISASSVSINISYDGMSAFPYAPGLTPMAAGAAPGPFQVPTGEQDEIMRGVVKGMGTMMRIVQAAQGALECERCTQKLSMKDVENGCCAKCEAPIE